jgi:hypothetical protein
MAKDNRLPCAPIFVVDLRSVPGFDRAHKLFRLNSGLVIPQGTPPTTLPSAYIPSYDARANSENTISGERHAVDCLRRRGLCEFISAVITAVVTSGVWTAEYSGGQAPAMTVLNG